MKSGRVSTSPSHFGAPAVIGDGISLLVMLDKLTVGFADAVFTGDAACDATGDVLDALAPVACDKTGGAGWFGNEPEKPAKD
jgi:hypothetical protein